MNQKITPETPAPPAPDGPLRTRVTAIPASPRAAELLLAGTGLLIAALIAWMAIDVLAGGALTAAVRLPRRAALHLVRTPGAA